MAKNESRAQSADSSKACSKPEPLMATKHYKSERLLGRQGRNEKGQERHNSPDAEKSQQCHKHFLQYSTFAPERHQVRTWRRQTSFLPREPSNLVASLWAVACILMTRRRYIQPGFEPTTYWLQSETGNLSSDIGQIVTWQTSTFKAQVAASRKNLFDCRGSQLTGGWFWNYKGVAKFTATHFHCRHRNLKFL